MDTVTASPPEAPPTSATPVAPAKTPPIAAPSLTPPSMMRVPTPSTVSVARPEGPRWVRNITEKLSALGATPRDLDLAGLATALLAAMLVPVGGLVESGFGTAALVLAAVLIQGRPFLGRLADAVHAKAQSRPEYLAGVPGLLCEAGILIAFGYAASATPFGPVLGWTCAVFGLLLSHVATLPLRAFPLPEWIEAVAPKHRMDVISFACILAALLPYGWRQAFLLLSLIVSAFGTGAVLWMRVSRAKPLR